MQSDGMYGQMLASGADSNADGLLSVNEVAHFWIEHQVEVAPPPEAEEPELLPPAPQLPDAAPAKPAAGAPSSDNVLVNLSDRVKSVFSPAVAPPLPSASVGTDGVAIEMSPAAAPAPSSSAAGVLAPSAAAAKAAFAPSAAAPKVKAAAAKEDLNA